MEIIDEFDEILKELRDKNPWKGTVAERVQKFAEAHQQLANLTHLVVDFVPQIPEKISEWHGSGGSYTYIAYDEGTDTSKFVFVMTGRLSVMTFLFLWQMLAKRGTPPLEFDYVEVFKRYWPDKFEKLTEDGGLFIKHTN